MGQLDDRSEERVSEALRRSSDAEDLLQTMTQDLRSLQQDLIAQMSQDIRRLQAEKSRLLNDIEKLQNQQQMLESQYEVALSRHQLAQQQAWAKQLALTLANHLHAALSQRLNQMVTVPQEGSGSSLPQISGGGAIEPAETQRLLVSLDETVNRTFATLKHDLSSYESALSQQIDRMHNLGQQGEVILEVLIKRITQQLQVEMARGSVRPASPSATRETPLSGNLPGDLAGNLPGNLSGNPVMPPSLPPTDLPPNPNSNTFEQGNSFEQGNPFGQVAPNPFEQFEQVEQSEAPFREEESEPSEEAELLPPLSPEPHPVIPRSRGRRLSQFQLGLVLILLSTLALSLHNVLVGIVGNPSRLFGLIPIGGFIKLNGFGSSLLILWLRMLVVVPLMVWLAPKLHQHTWYEIRGFFQSKDRLLLGSVLGSGFFLFLSQVLIYIAIGQIGPGVAVTILFMYPLATVPLAWALFGDRPTRLRLIVMAAILSGVIFTAAPKMAASAEVSWNGVITAVCSGIAFALYLISMQISFRKLHPVPVSVIQFASIFIFSSISLIVLGVEVAPTNRVGLAIGGLLLGALTLVGYLLNNFGVRLMGAARASIIAASGPALTAFLAFLLTPGRQTALQSVQILGILIVTLGVTALSFEKLLPQNRSVRQVKPSS
ncbi:EamA family transporter [Leptolyngbya ohadii]|uniref:EamA family transporter n=1 Tax=Leptolyngbya ohadii TaxID=1962290 RepID=UPI001CED1D85|nr:EamA family transporter [Leptolyngbya ohadii]